MPEEVKESAEKRRERWMEREAKKADTKAGGRKAELSERAKCDICGKEVEEGEYINIRGKILCAECYEASLENEMADIGAADGTGAG